jgi:hypothetical protein
MRTPKINTKKLAATLAPIALTGAMMAPTAAASTPRSAHAPAARAHAKVGLSQGFLIHNYTSQPLTLDNITGSGDFEGRPADGTTFNPGTTHDIEVQYWFASEEVDAAHYHFANGATATVIMEVNGVNQPSVLGCDTSYGTCTHDSKYVYLLDPPGTVYNLGPDQKQAQADLLNQLCEAKLASCKFTPTAEDHILGDERGAGDGTINDTDQIKSDMEIAAEDTRGESDSVGVDVTGGVEKLVVFEVTVKYEHEWTHEYKFSQTEHADVPPHTHVWYTHKAPMVRDTGDFTVTLGNTTWTLTNVYFDHPDLTDQAQQGVYILHSAPASQQELAWAKAHPGSLVPLS